ncbi:hypothetical protein DRE_07223 [Drechslerella stenobrocha 248]|uniref:BSD domain-containing protein n=1 Tax=Drechslerella stenobrocha 248 TaxID=1043628 RepID=W7HW16_9PEZI|nr:hypothetical protein DRE_07223 [Drechslerella stenobrocha 248]
MSAQAPASYKKKDGAISLALDGKSVIWQAGSSSPSNSSSSGQIVIPVDAITNLQATPPTSSKVMLKVFAQHPTKNTNDQYVFTFSCSHDEASHLKAALTAAIQALKLASVGDGPASADKDAPGKPADVYKHWTDSELRNDMALQQMVLSSSPSLQKAFHEVVVEGNMTASQFWSTRVHLLRAHLVEQSQTRGSYNVLATIKPKTEDAVVRVSLSRDQIHTIFEQHPIVRQIYDEVVPKLREDEFWRRFFLSRLYKKLKGEKLAATDAHDDILDQYLKAGNFALTGKPRRGMRIPHVIDVEGNEDDHSQKQGNRPDLTMRPNKTENVPIIRTLNHLSSKLVDTVTPVDLAKDTESQDIVGIRLLDLYPNVKEQNILLRARDHKQFFDAQLQPKESTTSGLYPIGVHAADLVKELYKCTARKGGSERHLESNRNRPYEPEFGGDTNPDEEGFRPLRAASSHISSILNARRAEMPSKSNIISGDSRYSGQQSWDRLLLTHATSTEFLRHFWDAFFSGDAKRTAEIRHMADSLTRSLERIDNIAKSAEEEASKLGKAQQDVDRRRPKRGHGGGTNDLTYLLVKRFILPQEMAIKAALARYRKALEGVEDALP